MVWSRLSLDLEPYLTERAAPGGTVMTFYHRQVAERGAGAFRESVRAQLATSSEAGGLLLQASRPGAKSDMERQQPASVSGTTV